MDLCNLVCFDNAEASVIIMVRSKIDKRGYLNYLVRCLELEAPLYFLWFSVQVNRTTFRSVQGHKIPTSLDGRKQWPRNVARNVSDDH